MRYAPPHVVLLILALILLHADTFAQPKIVSVRGRVVAAENDAALPNALIAVTVDGTETESVFVDDLGRFAVAVPPRPSMFTITASKAGYGASQISITGESARQLTDEFVFVLTRAAAITGRIVDASGDPAVETRVVAERLDVTPDLVRFDPIRFQADSDDRGEYRIGGLPPGRYAVGPLARLSDSTTLATIVLRSGDEVTSVNFAVPPSAEDRVAVALPPPDGRGTIRGRVLGPSGRPLSAATVSVFGAGQIGGGFRRSSRTDSEGRFVFAGLASGVFSVEATKIGYATSSDARGKPSSSRVEIRDDQRIATVELTLSRGSALSGRVVDERGEPIQGVTMQALQLTGGRARALARPVLPDRWTNDLGQFRIFGLTPGSYLVSASISEKGSAVNPGAGDYLPVYYPATTQASQAVPVGIDIGVDADGIDLVLTKSRGARVSGTVSASNGDPVTGLVMLIDRARAGLVSFSRRQTSFEGNGRFLLSGVPPGDYLLEALATNIADPTRMQFAVQPLTVTDGDPVPLTITTSPGSTLEGRVTIEGRQDRGFIPIPPFSLRPVPADGLNLGSIRGGSPVSLTGDGPFRMTMLNGPTRFVFAGPSDWFVKSITIAGIDVTDSPFDFSSKDDLVSGAEIVISTASATLEGYVTDADAARVNDYGVFVFSTDRAQWVAESRFMKLARPAPNGSFEVKGLPPGDYWVAALETAEFEDGWTPEIFDRIAARAQRVTLAERQRYATVLRRIQH